MRLLIAGGGTGGHLFPGVALAEELRAREPAAAVRFVGTERGIEARMLPELGWELTFIKVSGLKTVGFVGMLRGLKLEALRETVDAIELTDGALELVRTMRSNDVLAENFPPTENADIALFKQGTVLNEHYIEKMIAYTETSDNRQPVKVFKATPLTRHFQRKGGSR